MNAPSPSPTPPDWPHCGHGAGPAADPVGCRGVRVPGYTACLAHLDGADLDAHLASLSPGDDIDHRGTAFTEELLERLLDALRDPSTGLPRVGWAVLSGATFTGTARFDGTTFAETAQFGGASFAGRATFLNTVFAGDARFDRASFAEIALFVQATFTGAALFRRAVFSGDVLYYEATFTEYASFGKAVFTGAAMFDRAAFSGDVSFGKAVFTGAATFDRAAFSGNASFEEAALTRDLWFDRVAFAGDARFAGLTARGDIRFREARFAEVSRVGPLACGGRVTLDGAVFEKPVTLEIAAGSLSCVRTLWESTATLRLRYASVDLQDAVFTLPVAVTAHPAPFTFTTFTSAPSAPSAPAVSSVPEDMPPGRDPRPRVQSVQGVDAALLVLTGTDLSDCRFTGAFHLDQLRIEGRAPFAQPPAGRSLRRLGLRRWTRRRTLAEEHHWRAVHSPQQQGWSPGPHHPDADRTPGPEALAAVYRHLRKALEDGKNEPGAADFYYGECEMRRRDREGTTRAERVLLHLYWALSGYGLRAARALSWLLGTVAATVLVMMAWGLPADSPKPLTTGRQVAPGQELALTTDTPDPVNPSGPYRERLSTERFEKSLRVVINSVVFRSSGQDLTTFGTYAEMFSRLTEPVLLGLAVLAVRSRVKR